MESTLDTRLNATLPALFGLGLLGVLSLIPTLVGELDALLPELADFPSLSPLVASLIHAVLLLAIAVAVGTLLAHGVRLRSLICVEGAGQETNLASAAPLHVPRAFMIGAVFRIDFGLP